MATQTWWNLTLACWVGICPALAMASGGVEKTADEPARPAGNSGQLYTEHRAANPGLDARPGLLRQGGETFEGAEVIVELPFTDSGSTATALNDYSPGCGFSSAPDVVYSFVPDEDMLIDVDLCGSSFDTILSVFENDSSTLVGCNDDGCGDQSRLEYLELSAGNTYFILVDGFSNRSGDYTLSVARNSLPTPCETFDAGLTTIDGLPFSYSGDNGSASNVWGSSGSEIGFLLTLEQVTPLHISTCLPGNLLDSRVYILSGHPCEQGTQEILLNTGSSSCAYGNSVDFNTVLQEGSYTLLVGGDFEDDVNALELLIEVDSNWVNPCESSQPITCGDVLSVNNSGAPDFYAGLAGDLLFDFNLDARSQVLLSTCAAETAIDTKLYLFDRCPTDPTVDYLDTNDDADCAFSTLSSTIDARLEAGHYWVLATGYAANEGAIGLSMSCTANLCPDLAEPFSLVENTRPGSWEWTLPGATIAAHFSDPEGDPLSAEDVLVQIPENYQGGLQFDVTVTDGECEVSETIALVLEPLLAPFALEGTMDPHTGVANLSWAWYEDMISLSYDPGVAWDAIAQPGLTQAVRMSPEGPCQLIGLAYFLFNDQEDPEFVAQAFSWEGSAPAAEPFFTRSVLAQTQHWSFVPVHSEELYLEEDFVVGFGSVNASVLLGRDPQHDAGRSWSQDSTGTWTAVPANCLVRAVVRYLDQSVALLDPAPVRRDSRLGTATGPVSERRLGGVEVPFQPLPAAREFLHFELARNGQSIGSSAEASFSDTLHQEGDFSYTVSAVYDEGLSLPSEPLPLHWVMLNTPVNLAAQLDPETGQVQLSWEMSHIPQTLVYDNDTADGAYTYEGWAMAVQMSPEEPCRIIELQYWTTDTVGDSPFQAEVYACPEGVPDTTLLASLPAVALENGWVSVDCSGLDLHSSGDFMAGFGSLNAGAHLAFDGSLNHGRSWDYDHEGNWTPWNEAYMIRAVVVYDSGRMARLEPVLPTRPASASREHGERLRLPMSERPASPASREFLSWTVYRNGEVVGSSTEPDFTDTLPGGGEYEYWITSLYDEGESLPSAAVSVLWDAVSLEAGLPLKFFLEAPVPNPFNPVTQVRFGLPRASSVKATLYNITGARVALLLDQALPAGEHRLSVDGSALSSGIYLLELTAGPDRGIQRLTLLK
ncbi:MAG: hypothetical protein H6678_08955 [Candidatus Delongbacteria bacterium]|nr:hypothetical protein [Candidatus Delongbacteria bacterium]